MRRFVPASILLVSFAASASFAQNSIYTTRDAYVPPPAQQQQNQPAPFMMQQGAQQPPRGMLTPQAAPRVQSPQYRGVPFGRASAEALAPVPKGPRTTTSAPLDSIASDDLEMFGADMIASEDLPAPGEPEIVEVEPEVTLYDEELVADAVIIRALHKVTAQHVEITIDIGDTARFGLLAITPRACRVAAEGSRPESAILLELVEYPAQRYDVAVLGATAEGTVVSDQPTAAWQGGASQQPAKPVFSGWMFASSPSVNGLEHPVYDVSVVRCVTN